MSETVAKNPGLLSSAFRGETANAIQALEAGSDVNMVDPSTGLSALHIAAGTNNLDLMKRLVEEFDAAFFADRFGRLPTTVAVECGANPDALDYIVDAEAKFIGMHCK